jgi:hypothetical protein
MFFAEFLSDFIFNKDTEHAAGKRIKTALRAAHPFITVTERSLKR